METPPIFMSSQLFSRVFLPFFHLVTHYYWFPIAFVLSFLARFTLFLDFTFFIFCYYFKFFIYSHLNTIFAGWMASKSIHKKHQENSQQDKNQFSVHHYLDPNQSIHALISCSEKKYEKNQNQKVCSNSKK